MENLVKFITTDEEEKEFLAKMWKEAVNANVKAEVNNRETLEEIAMLQDEKNREIQKNIMEGATLSSLVGSLNKNIARNKLKEKYKK